MPVEGRSQHLKPLMMKVLSGVPPVVDTTSTAYQVGCGAKDHGAPAGKERTAFGLELMTSKLQDYIALHAGGCNQKWHASAQ